MSDFLNDVYPISVDFVDGQQPTAAFFNAWEGQIDAAFILLSQAVGDIEGDGGVGETYITNLARSFGKMGWINSRLPRDLRVPVGQGVGAESNLPVIEEDIGTFFEDKKSAILTFLPAAAEATDGDDLITDTSDPGDDLGTAQVKGAFPTANLTLADRWVLDGRRILTSSLISSGAKISYGLQTDSTLYRDAYGEETGANVVPSVYEIGSALGDLVVITQPGGYGVNEYLLTFPEIRRIQNPLFPDSTTEANTIKLDDPASAVRWSGTAPKWRIPTWLYNKASEPAFGGRIPDGTVALWHDSGTAITRVVDPTNTNIIRWDLVPGDFSSVKITVDFALPAAPGAGGDNRYIVAFAGTSVAEALIHERARMLAHKHDGQGDESLIEATHLKSRFNEENFFFSNSDEFNHFPQYLLRGGYDANDALNRYNAMLGALLIGSSSATPSNPVSPSDIAATSHSIIFGDYASGPSVRWNALDVNGVAGDTDGKLGFAGKAVRFQENAYFGPAANTSYLTSRLDVGIEVLEHAADTIDTLTVFETGKLSLRAGRADFIGSAPGEKGILAVEDTGADIKLHWYDNVGRNIFEAGLFQTSAPATTRFRKKLMLTNGLVTTGTWGAGALTFFPFAEDVATEAELIAAYSIPDLSLVNTTDSFGYKIENLAIQQAIVDLVAYDPGGATDNVLTIGIGIFERDPTNAGSFPTGDPGTQLTFAPAPVPGTASASTYYNFQWETDGTYAPASASDWETKEYWVRIYARGSAGSATRIGISSITIVYEVI